MTDRAANPPLVAQAHGLLASRARWSVLEIAFWLAAFASIFLLQSKHLILTEIAILALFALSLDLLLGIADVAGKYYVPKLGGFVIYTIMIVVLIWRPQGLFSRAIAK